MTKITRIFLDLDGVLADWATAAIRAHNRDPKLVLELWPAGVYEMADVIGISGNALWRPIDAAGAEFWAELEPLPWMFDLFKACTTIAPTTILTSPSKHVSCPGGKTAWLQRHFGSSFRNYLIGPDKAACARRGAVLIDDRDDGCKAFEAAGGHAVVFPQPWNTEHAVVPWTDRVGPVGYVLAKLHAIDAQLEREDRSLTFVGYKPPRSPAVPEGTRRKLAELRDAVLGGVVPGAADPDRASSLTVTPFTRPIVWSSADLEAAMATAPKHVTRVLKAREPGDDSIVVAELERFVYPPNDLAGPDPETRLAAGDLVEILDQTAPGDPPIGALVWVTAPASASTGWLLLVRWGTTDRYPIYPVCVRKVDPDAFGGALRQAAELGLSPVAEPGRMFAIFDARAVVDNDRATVMSTADSLTEAIFEAPEHGQCVIISWIDCRTVPLGPVPSDGTRREWADPRLEAEGWPTHPKLPEGWSWEYADGAWQARSEADVLVGYDADGQLVALDAEGEPVNSGNVPTVIELVRDANPHKLAIPRPPGWCAAGCGEAALDDDPTCGRDGCVDDHPGDGDGDEWVCLDCNVAAGSFAAGEHVYDDDCCPSCGGEFTKVSAEPGAPGDGDERTVNELGVWTRAGSPYKTEAGELDELIDASVVTCPTCGDLDKPVDGPCQVCGV
jgi:hypothetical protein